MSMHIQRKIENAVARANFSLRRDVLGLLRAAYKKEKNKKAKNALGWILENAKIAKNENLAICQDTGLPILFIQAGKGANVSLGLIKTIERSIETGYRKNYLRPSLTDPLKRHKSSFSGVVTHIEFNPGIKGIKITVFPKGFGSENKTQLRMFNPTVSLKEIEGFVLDCVKKAGPEACPPFIVGVGIGGSADYALLLAKKALLKRVDKPNKDMLLNNLEKSLFKKINALNIGPMGLGGRTSVLAVKVKTAPTHIAGLPVGINISCHTLRSAEINL